ncbi:hypothetical protein D5S17_31765 [Pseudonocardiaceae bacterium YIM PH 21723]|nr:hypothetical protein D5S17_31765 [Pseudonocardiaceae bacterium YIM PH 21723]
MFIRSSLLAAALLTGVAPAANAAASADNAITITRVQGSGAGTVTIGGALSCAEPGDVLLTTHFDQLEGTRARGAVENQRLSCSAEKQDWSVTVPISGYAVPGRLGESHVTMRDTQGGILADWKVKGSTAWSTPAEKQFWETYITKITPDGVHAGTELVVVCEKGKKFVLAMTASSPTGANGEATSPEITCPGAIRLSPKALGKPGNSDFRPGADTTVTVTLTSDGVEESNRTLTIPAGY